jgi:hypothetical protein
MEDGSGGEPIALMLTCPFANPLKMIIRTKGRK